MANKLLILLLLVFTIFTSCTNRITSSYNKNCGLVVDSINNLNWVNIKKIDAKLQVDEDSYNAKLKVSLHRDSTLLFQIIIAPMEIARLYSFNDSLLVINRVKSEYFYVTGSDVADLNNMLNSIFFLDKNKHIKRMSNCSKRVQFKSNDFQVAGIINIGSNYITDMQLFVELQGINASLFCDDFDVVNTKPTINVVIPKRYKHVSFNHKL